MANAWGDPTDEAGDTGTNQTVRGNWVVSGAVFVAPRVGVGIDTFPKHDTSAVLVRTHSSTLSGQLQEKTTLMVTARGRPLARSHFAIDGVFGVGALRQTRTYMSTDLDPRATPSTSITHNTSAAFSVGADAPISVVPHVAVIPQMRWYHLRRLGNEVTYPTAFDPPAWLFAFGVTAGVTW